MIGRHKSINALVALFCGVELVGKQVGQVASPRLSRRDSLASPKEPITKVAGFGFRCDGDCQQDLRLERLAELLCEARHVGGIADRLVSFVKLFVSSLESVHLDLLTPELVGAVSPYPLFGRLPPGDQEF